jgi:[protein-PII] uridylyltransferase
VSSHSFRISPLELQATAISQASRDDVALRPEQSALHQFYTERSADIRREFDQSHNGQAAIQARSDLIDRIVIELWNAAAADTQDKVTLVALAGYGRQQMFPCSDVDLMFLSRTLLNQHSQKQVIPKICQALWDLHLRVSPTVRTLDECGKLHRDNTEFNISLLDCRHICGDAEVFYDLKSEVIPRTVRREALELQQRLIDLTADRHEKFGRTIFHLEPNIKECPGGMRDYQVATWLALISEIEKTGNWPADDNPVSATLSVASHAAFDFLCAVRCFLHYQQARDLNTLTYELQSEAAAAGIGLKERMETNPAEWMRQYFRHARAIQRLDVLFDEIRPARSGLYRLFESRKSRLSNADFSVVDGRVFLRQLSSVEDPGILFALFEFVARHGVKLSSETERCVESALANAPECGEFPLWDHLRQILVLLHAGKALRAMHRLGLLVYLFPEFQAIDSLVIRDYFHRYTVDEHSFVAIENIHALRGSTGDLERRLRDILEGVEHPELLFLAILFHDVGKGTAAEDHLDGSLSALQSVSQRLQLQPTDREMVRFLVANHLRISETLMRRDIFDLAVVQEFCVVIGTIENLRLLTLLTYGDIKAVNPEALTPWKAEMLWQLYVSSSNYLTHSLDDQRVHTQNTAEPQLAQITALAHDLNPDCLGKFLEGLPKRYLLTHSPNEIVSHYHAYERLKTGEAQIEILRRNGHFELMLLTLDRPALFTAVVGLLSSWGMDILKAEAFANQTGVVLDTFRFSDRFCTLELNPGEIPRLKRQLRDAISGEINVSDLMEKKFQPPAKNPKVRIESRVHVDNSASAHSTLLEITAQDRPGLLYEIGSVLTVLGCNIEVAMIDTQGHTALDIFYLTRSGEKLDPQRQNKLRDTLLAQL